MTQPFADNTTSTKRILYKEDTAVLKAGLTLNAKKNKILYIKRRDNLSEERTAVKVNGAILEKVHQLKFLGSIKKKSPKGQK